MYKLKEVGLATAHFQIQCRAQERYALQQLKYIASIFYLKLLAAILQFNAKLGKCCNTVWALRFFSIKVVLVKPRQLAFVKILWPAQLPTQTPSLLPTFFVICAKKYACCQR